LNNFCLKIEAKNVFDFLFFVYYKKFFYNVATNGHGFSCWFQTRDVWRIVQSSGTFLWGRQMRVLKPYCRYPPSPTTQMKRLNCADWSRTRQWSYLERTQSVDTRLNLSLHGWGEYVDLNIVSIHELHLLSLAFVKYFKWKKINY